MPFLAVLLLSSAFAPASLNREFTQEVHPFLDKYCVGCHSGTSAAAQFDLRGYSDISSVVRDHPRWAIASQKLAAKEMPPKGAPQPPEEKRKAIVDWISAVRESEARKHAGDPGAVLARRLSNAEYNYTIRDLTGVDMRPTREFPVDPANPEGFDNSGESLSMSPALLNKYLQAAREVGDHMVLTPDGFDFSPHPMLVETDREKYAIQRIVNFYERQPTDYADYFQAAWKYKHRVQLGKPRATLATVANEAKLSAKYLPMVWSILELEPNAAGPVAKLQDMWKKLAEQPQEPERVKFVEMRDFVVRLRSHTAMQFAAPVVKGLSATSQPLMNYKLRQFASHRRDFDRSALLNEGDPPPVVPTIPRYPGLGQESAVRARALMLKARDADPDLVVPKGQRASYEAAFARLSSVFPDVFYIKERGRFFPDDSQDKGRLLSAGYHNVMGYFRDDTPLQELILDEKGKKELDRLWQEFEYIGDYTTRTYVQYFFNQSGEVRGKGRESGTERPTDNAVTAEAVIMDLQAQYLAKAAADPGNDPVAPQAIRDHFARVNATIRQIEKMRPASEAKHLDALVRFAAKAYRRPLAAAEAQDIRTYYRTLRDKNSLSHEDAIRDSIVSVLMSPDFCYRMDSVNTSAAPGVGGGRPLTPFALASRLSYFLWSSMPDEELMRHASSGDLLRRSVLAAQTKRMLRDNRARGFATEFAGNWLDFRRFDQHNAVDRQRFPMFDNALRQAMFEQPIRFIEDLIQMDRSVLDAVYGDYTWVNAPLARHYGMPEVKGAPDHWVRIENAARYGRGGLLPMSVFLTQNSPGLRTSPVKRGYWVAKRLLGETIPPPPPNVPELPQDEAKSDLPLRAMLEQHRNNPACASCHARFDSFGLAFENYGPVGEARTKDLAGRPVDVTATFPGGVAGSGIAGVQAYIREHREGDFIDNVNRKLLAYALGRSLLLSDEPLLQRMRTRMTANGYRISTAVDAIVSSPQFGTKRISEPRQISRLVSKRGA